MELSIAPHFCTLLLSLIRWQVEVGLKADGEERDFGKADDVSTGDLPRVLKGKKGRPPPPPPPPYQADPKITRPQLVGAHTKWLYCSSAFWVLGEGQCERKQRFVPDGYWFETGRLMPNTTNCSALTGDGDVPTASCRFKRGLKMVLTVVNFPYWACDTEGALEDPRLGPATLQDLVTTLRIVKATVDGKDIDFQDALMIVTQDGDADYTYPTVRDRCVQSDQVDFPLLGGCPLYAGGPYVFIDTKNLTKGAHELVMIGEDTSDGFCSAVKHLFILY
jgi:hypothetical protein